jgi:hypothetical protein
MTQFTSNAVLNDICWLIPKIERDWDAICESIPKSWMRGFYAEQVVGRLAELHIDNVLDVLRDHFNLPITSPTYPLVGSQYEIRDDRRGQHGVYLRGSPEKLTEVDVHRFADGLPFVVETKISSHDDHRANKQLLTHARSALNIFSTLYAGKAGYIAVLQPEKVTPSGHRAVVRSLGAHIVSLGMRREDFFAQAIDAARKHGLWSRRYE